MSAAKPEGILDSIVGFFPRRCIIQVIEEAWQQTSSFSVESVEKVVKMVQKSISDCLLCDQSWKMKRQRRWRPRGVDSFHGSTCFFGHFNHFLRILYRKKKKVLCCRVCSVTCIVRRPRRKPMILSKIPWGFAAEHFGARFWSGRLFPQIWIDNVTDSCKSFLF